MRHHHTNLCRSQQRHAMGISLVVLPMKQEAMGKSREATGYTHREVTGNQSAKCKRKTGHCEHCHNFAAFLPILRKSGALQTYPTYLESVNQVSSYVEIQLIIYIYQYLGMGDIIKEIPSQKSQNKSLRIHTK